MKSHEAVQTAILFMILENVTSSSIVSIVSCLMGLAYSIGAVVIAHRSKRDDEDDEDDDDDDETPVSSSNPLVPNCPCCGKNDRVIRNPNSSRPEVWFCPCNEPGSQYFDAPYKCYHPFVVALEGGVGHCRQCGQLMVLDKGAQKWVPAFAG